jgi:hypothetical protein
MLEIFGHIRSHCPPHFYPLAVGEPRDLFILNYPRERLRENFTLVIFVFETFIDECGQLFEELFNPLRSQRTGTLKQEMCLIRFQVDFTDFAGFRHRPTPDASRQRDVRTGVAYLCADARIRPSIPLLTL